MFKSRILVVDDSDDARKGISIYLKAKDYDVTEAEDGETAVQLLKKNKYNIVLTDLKMQDLDGIDVLKEVKKLHPDTDVVIMTAFASVETAVDAMKLGAYDYIPKPLNMEELELVVERSLEKQRLIEEVEGLKEIVNLFVTSKALGSIMELDELLVLILKLACDSISAEGSSVMLYEKETDELVVKVATGSFRDEVIGKRLKVGERFAGKAAQRRQTIIQADVENEDWFKKLHKYENIKSGMSIPMIIKGELIGVINLKRTESDDKFTQRDIKLAKIFAEQAAFSIHNAWLYEKLRKRDKFKTEFVSNVSHAMKTSLMSIKLSQDLMLSGKAGTLSPVAKNLLDINSRGVARLTELVRSILDISQIESGTFNIITEETDLVAVINNTISKVGLIAGEKKIAVEASLPSSSVNLKADPARMGQALENILINGINFTDPGGKVTLRLKDHRDKVEIKITDTGIGISEEELENIFNRFYKIVDSEKKQVGGSGLGLSIAKNIIDKHDGTITVESKVGKGSSFTITVPKS